jgi:hypothetical protein
MRIVYTCLGAICLAVLTGALSGWIFMLLWNWLAPLFWSNAPILTFWQAWGVCIILSWIGSLIRGSKSSN